MKRNHYLPFRILPFIILAAIVLLSSCVTLKQREKICMSCPVKIITKDSIWTKETLRVDTTYKTITGPVQWLQSPCDSNGNLKPINTTTKKNGIKTTIKSVGNNLQVNSNLDSLMEVNKLLTIENNILHSEIKEVPVCYKEHITDNDVFWIKVGKWLFWILIGYILLRILKLYLKKTFPVIARFIP